MDEQQQFKLVDLYRNFLLSDLLGEDKDDILYWAGKEITRKYDLTDLDAVQEFFATHALGQLNLLDQKKDQALFSLTGPIIDHRFATKDTSYSLEAGIIAEAIQRSFKHIAEAQVELNMKKQTIAILVKIDLAD